MRRLLIIALGIVVCTTWSEGVQQSNSTYDLPAPAPNLEAIRGVTSEFATQWTPIVEYDHEAIWRAYPAGNNGFISVATGSPIPFCDDLANISKLEVLGSEFIMTNSARLGVSDASYVMTECSNRGRITVASFEIQQNRVAIEDATIILVLNQNGDLISIKANGYGNQYQGDYSISPEIAQQLAIKSLPIQCDATDVRRIYLPISSKIDGTIIKAAYRIELRSGNPAYSPTLWVDATTGEVIAAENSVHFLEVEGASSGGIFPNYGRDELEVMPFVDQEIRLEDTQTYTDEEGLFRLDLDENDAPFGADVFLQGRWVEVSEFDEEVENAHFVGEFADDQFADILWNEEVSSPDERNLYYHVNVIHAFFKELDPDFDGMDFPIAAICGVGGPGLEQLEDNAFSNGPEIYFGRGRNADNFAHYCDVVYHEYGHSVTGQLYGNHALPYAGESGALNEGWSDYFTCSLTEESYIGEGGLLGNGYIRNIDNRLVYPENLTGEVHDDSRIISAAMWHTREVLGKEYTDSLFHFARYLYADDFREYFLDVLITDDDDGDLSNGSPNYATLYEQFARHGIGLADSVHFRIKDKVVTDFVEGGGEGDRNGIYEPGESISIDFSIFRTGAPVPLNDDSVFVQLDTDSPYLTIIRPRVILGALRPGDSAESPFPLLAEIADDAPLAFANLYLTVGASDGEATEIDTIRIALGRPDVALIGDGISETDRRFYFQRSLNSLGIVYSDLHAVNPVRPLRETISNFQKVIWFTGDAQEGAMSEDSRDALEIYLDNGGKLIVSGQFIGNWPDAEQFREERLGARLLPDSSSMAYVEWIKGDQPGDTLTIIVRGGIGANNQRRPAAFEAINRGEPTFRWSRAPGNPAATIRRFDRVTQAKTILFGFGLEAVGGAGRTMGLDSLLKISLDWLDAEVSVSEEVARPVEFGLEPAYPNPFNGLTTLVYSLPRHQEVLIKVVDLSGREIETLVNGVQNAGSHRIVWESLNAPSGLYYVTMSSDNATLSQRLLLIK